MTEEAKGLIFILLMIPIGIRYLIKTGNKDLRLNKIDYAVAIGIFTVVLLVNIL
jgi:hypothetical protein